MVEDVTLVRCNRCLRELPISHYNPSDNGRNCRDCRSGIDANVRRRAADDRLRKSILGVAERIAKRKEEPISRDDAILNRAVERFGGTDGVGDAIFELYQDPDTRAGVRLGIHRLLTEGIQRSEKRKLEKRNLDQHDIEEIDGELCALFGIDENNLDELYDTIDEMNGEAVNPLEADPSTPATPPTSPAAPECCAGPFDDEDEDDDPDDTDVYEEDEDDDRDPEDEDDDDTDLDFGSDEIGGDA